jgi:peptide/nickel transport system ATP-binding protein
VFAERAHPYTQGLFAARPALGAPRGVRLATIPGSVPELVDLPPGCPFAGRCGFTINACHTTRPPISPMPHGHAVRCIRLDDVLAQKAAA